MQKTEKIQLYDGNVTKAMLTATYMYTKNFEKNDTRDEEFIVGFHLEDEALENIDTGCLLLDFKWTYGQKSYRT